MAELSVILIAAFILWCVVCGFAICLVRAADIGDRAAARAMKRHRDGR